MAALMLWYLPAMLNISIEKSRVKEREKDLRL